MNTYITPYKKGSKSAQVIADGIGAKFLYDNHQKPVPEDSLIFNWGRSTSPNIHCSGDVIYLNSPEFVEVAGNKLKTFNTLKDKQGVIIPEWTTDKTVALGWYNKKRVVLSRTILTGHSGNGIVIWDDDNKPDAPLYVQYVRKTAEYRVHVAFEEVIDVQQKRKQLEFQGTYNPYIRSHHNGWVYCRENLEVYNNSLYTTALEAVKALNLDYGAVDIVYNAKSDRYHVLEVNTAPGLEGETMFSYVIAFLNYMESL